MAGVLCARLSAGPVATEILRPRRHPAGPPRRFDSRFFCVPAEAIVHRVAAIDDELSDLEWHSIAQARSLELPNITRVVLEDLGERIAAGALHSSDMPVPFYHRRNGAFRRD